MLVLILPSISIQYLSSKFVSGYPFVLINYQYIWTDTGWLPKNILGLSRCWFVTSFSAISLSCNDLILFWSILLPIHSISVLKSSDLVSLSLYPAFSSRVRTSTNSFLDCSFDFSVTTIMSSNHAGCLLSSV